MCTCNVLYFLFSFKGVLAIVEHKVCIVPMMQMHLVLDQSLASMNHITCVKCLCVIM